MSAQLSRTLVAILQILFPPPFRHERVHRLGALERAAQAADKPGRDRLDENPLRRGLHVSPRALLDLKFPAQPPGDDDPGP